MGAPVALSVTPTARTYRPSGPHMPMIAPGIEAAVISWPMAVSSRCAVPASISWAASVSAVFVVAVADDGDDVESLPHADTKINSATAIVAFRLLIASAPYRGIRLHRTLLARSRAVSNDGLRAGPQHSRVASMGPNEHRIGGEPSRANEHSEQVPAHTEFLAVDARPRGHPDRFVLEHGNRGVQWQWVADALDDDLGVQVDVVSVGGFRRRDDHADLRELLHVEEVRRPQMLVAFPDSRVQRRSNDVDPARNRTRLGDPTPSPDLSELALHGHRAPHRLVPEFERRPVGSQRPPAHCVAQNLCDRGHLILIPQAG